ncbi:HDOD domain-containing protein [Hydrogenophaga sp.]|uniref:HDOD domain-containing protein n=1 Tax=Hydrogenophaga sp. TaxID=1904254 RepID=UPI0025C1FAF3|nr:HDOD domain-containing protein [Hydrogenophaga sp.]
MSHTVLDSIALGYQPVWNRARQLAAVRLRVQVVQPDSVDAEHLLRVVGNDWPAAAPTLILSSDHTELILQALQCAPARNTWLELPGAFFEVPEHLVQLSAAVRAGHQLLRQADLSDLRGEVITPLDVRSLLTLGPEDVLQALRHAGDPDRPGGLPPGQIFAGIADRQLAGVCLDGAGAWGLLGWPDVDVLHAHRQQPMNSSARVIAQMLAAMDQDCSLDRLERLVRQDPVLVYRLLTKVNSAASGGRREIESLRHSLMMMGFGALARWLQEQQVGSERDVDLHPVRYAMVMRARLAQHLLDPGSAPDLRGEVYTTALFAQLDRLLYQPLGTLINKLPLSERLFDALLRGTGPYHPLLDVARVQGDPDTLHQLPAVCERHEMNLEHANRSLLRMLASSRDHAHALAPT